MKVLIFSFWAVIIFANPLELFSQKTTISCYQKVYTEGINKGDYEKIILCTNGQSVRALCSSKISNFSGFSTTFLFGQKNGDIITGKRLSYLPYEADILHIENSFKIKISPDNSILKYYHGKDLVYNFNSSELYATDLKYSFEEGKRNIRELSTTSSKILENIDISHANVQLLEFGNFEKIGKKSDFWYKVKINNLEGWTFGGLIISDE